MRGWCVDEDAAGSGIRDARRPGTEADSEMRCTVYVGCGEVEHQVRHVGLLCFWSFPYHLLSEVGLFFIHSVCYKVVKTKHR